jgi:2-polyprenyl-6-methoxyphenol hydroxylase-like FAD-dependent oxidoreductase
MLRIGVVGAGIAGTAAALYLARAGHRVELFERAPVLGPVGAGLLLQPSGQAVLRDLGLLPAVTNRSEPIAELRAEQVSGRSLIRLPYAAAHPEWTGYGVARGLLFSTLLAACRDAGVSIHTGAPVLRVRSTSQAIELYGPGDESRGSFDFALAADGARSPLRTSSGLAHRSREYGFGALWTIGPCTTVRGYLSQIVRGTTVLVGLLPLGDGRASFFWGDRPEGIEALRRRGFDAFRERVLAIAPNAEEIFTEFEGFDQAAFTTYLHVSAPRWHTGRLLFVGDAAHAMSPHLGQGANLALADAASFARHLAATQDFASAVARFEAERQPQVRPYSQLSWLLTPFFQSGSTLLGWGRDLALPLLVRTPPIRRLMAKTLAGKLGEESRQPSAGST